MINHSATTEYNGKRRALAALVKLSLPAIMQQLMGTLLQYVDTAMVGRLGEAATAAVSTSTSVNWLLHAIPYGLTVGVLSRLSQACGRGDGADMKRLAALGCRLSLWLGGILTFVCVIITPFLPVWMQADQAIRRTASLYFLIVSLSLPFSVAGSMFASCLHAVKDTRTPMIINLSANALNVVLNYVLIYRCSLGVTGAACATALSTAAGGLGLLAACRHKASLRFDRQDYFAREKARMLALLRVALPVTCTSAVSCMGYIVFAGMVNSMGVTVFAAHSIAVTAEEFFYLPGYGIRTATSSLIGSAIGEGDNRKFAAIRGGSLWLTVAVMVVSGGALFLLTEPLMRIFTTSQPVIRMGADVLRLVAFSEPFFGLMVAWEGISYGTGRTRSVFLIESFSMWGVRILLTWYTVRAGLGLTAVWYCMIADNVFKAVALTICGLWQIHREAREADNLCHYEASTQ